MESATYYSPGSGSKTANIDLPKATTADGQSMKPENSSYSLEAISVDSSYKEAERDRTVENKSPNVENKSPSSMKELEDKIIALKVEIEDFNCQKGEHEHEHEHEQDYKGLKDTSEFRLEYAFKEKEGEVLKKLDECEKFFKGKIEESMDRILNLEIEVDSLRSQNKNLSLKREQELESLRIQNQESEFELSKKTKEASVSLELLESLTEKLQQKTENEAGLVEERDAFKQQVKDLEIIIESINDENRLSKYENEKQRTVVSELQEKLQEKDGQISTLESEIESVKWDLSNKLESFEQKYASLEIDKMELSELQQRLQEKDGQILTLESEIEIDKRELFELQERLQEKDSKIMTLESKKESDKMQLSELQEKLKEKDSQILTLELEIESVKRDLSNNMKSLEQKNKSLEIDKMDLEGKNDDLAASLEQRDMQVNKLNHEANSSFRSTVKKMGEMADDFKKKSEDSVRILGRRICVAEQLHNETREWYKRTQEKNEQDRKDSELALHNIQIIMSMVSDTLSVSETFGLRFVECCEAVMNHVSKVSCEINFIKDWMKRKNEENEILGSRAQVLKLENKLWDLEKIVKEDDETIIVLKEEKKEAIRQLCMWIDYHSGRSDFFKKAFFESLSRYQRPG